MLLLCFPPTAYKALASNDIEFSSQAFPGIMSKWHGYDRYDFIFNDRDATVVAPSSALPGNPWKVSCIYLDAPVCDLSSWPGSTSPWAGR